MKKYAAFILILLIWNIVLTVFVFYKKEKETTVTNENVYGFSTDLTKVAEDAKSSVVVVETTYGKQSGFIYKQQDSIAYIVTTFHGIGNDTIASVTLLNGKVFTANIVGYDFLSDIAVLSIETPYKLNVVKCGDNEYLKAGEFVINIGTGSHADYINDIELGVVSNNLINIVDNITYNKEKYSVDKELVSISLNVGEGYSGSPVFNMSNSIVGMVEMDNSNNGIYAITINEIKLVADSIISQKEINKMNLGISGEYVASLEEYEKNIYNLPLDVLDGYYVKTVASEGLASKIGVSNGDIVESINGMKVVTQKDLLNIIYGNTSNDITLLIIRNNEKLELKGKIIDD